MWKCPKCETINEAEQCVICGEMMPRPIQEPTVYQNTFNQPSHQPYTQNIQQPQTQPYPAGQPVYPPYNMPPEGYYSAPVKKKSKAGLIIAIILTVVLIAGGVIGAIYFLSEDEATNTTIEPLYTDNGDTITFGHYEQDNNLANGKEPIEWKVLKREGNKALITSKYALDCKPYNAEKGNAKWEDSTLRKWLVNDFMNLAFNEEQKNLIQETTLPDNYMIEKIFLLSKDEAENYFDSDSDRQVEATEYAKANGVFVDVMNNKCCWWLRTQGLGEGLILAVGSEGDIGKFGADVIYSSTAVRPALWINLK